MKSWPAIILILLCLVLILVCPISCKTVDAKKQESSQLVEHNDLAVTVSGSGNIEISNEMKLTFGIAGKVDKIYVKEGDNVREGDLLAKLEIDALELALTESHVAKNKAEIDVIQAELVQKTAEYELEKAQDLYSEVEIYQARQAVSEARQYLEYTQFQQSQASTAWDINTWTNEVDYAEKKLRAAEVGLNDVLSTPDTQEVAIKRLQLELAQQSLELAQQSLELVRQSLELAQKRLDDATITTPFDSVVAKIGVDEGDTVSAATIIVHLIDLGSMELNVEVDEIDIAEVKVGQRAIIEADALPNLLLEGTVSSISLLPTQEIGMVMYDVKIDFEVTGGIGLRTGMSATADIIINK
ncbi:HlyD family secretion protein [Chloroflexota bacterium]